MAGVVMIGSSTCRPTSFVVRLPTNLAPPAWVRGWLGEEAVTRPLTPDTGTDIGTDTGLVGHLTAGPDATLMSLTLREARRLSPHDLRRVTADLYRVLLQLARQNGHRHLVRIWNYLPGIHEPLGRAQDRYRVFNAGRFDALCEAFGGRGGLADFTPAASGVGHDGVDLTVHALATTAPGRPVENPRQVPAYRYSERFGHLPPCFARATVVTRPRPAVLVAGTAAITGEDSRHPDNLVEQLDLTFENLRRLIDAVGEQNGGDPLRRFRQLRVYLPAASAMDVVRPAIDAVFERAEVQYVRADLCRRELLVEIEGVAEVAEVEPTVGTS